VLRSAVVSQTPTVPPEARVFNGLDAKTRLLSNRMHSIENDALQAEIDQDMGLLLEDNPRLGMIYMPVERLR
jgi:hypothetical protein